MDRNSVSGLLLFAVVVLCGSYLMRISIHEQYGEIQHPQQTIINVVAMQIEGVWFEDTAAGKSINATVTFTVAHSVMMHVSVNNAKINCTSKIIAVPGGQLSIGFPYDWVAGASYDVVIYVTGEDGRFVYEQQSFHAVAPS